MVLGNTLTSLLEDILAEITKIQQEKIEELTLYIIEQNKINEKQSKEIEELKTLIKSIIK